ncbi:Bax inhibitor 1 [Allomyces arbusculus]|nr:Bax inhibitor 1 [Allomyces arbusculus]
MNDIFSASTSMLETPVAALLSFAPLSPVARQHVTGAYTTLAWMTAITAATSYGVLTGWLPALHPLIPFIGMMVALGIFRMSSRTKDALTTRRAALAGFAALEGASLVSLLELVQLVSPRILPQAVVSTLLVFTSFSVAAMTSTRRSMIYLFGFLGSALSILAWMSFANVFMNSRLLFNGELYLGLLVFAGYVMFDTQVMLARVPALAVMDRVGREHAHMDSAIELYLDLVNVFVRIAIIMAKNAAKDQVRRNGGGDDSDDDDRRSSRRAGTRRR